MSTTKLLASICNVSNPLLAFGIYDARPGALNTTNSTVTVTCSDMKGDVPFNLGLVQSKQNFSMNRGADVMYYQLFTSASYSTLWSNTNLISGIVKNNGGNGVIIITIYGRIIPNQIGKKSGAYNTTYDPVIINLNYSQ
jgi:spore coat protein U-like protein